MLNKLNSTKLSIFVVITSFLIIFLTAPETVATNDVHEIATFDDLVKYAELSRTDGYQDDTYKLTSDIVISDENQSTLEEKDFNYISFGSSDLPFTGTFDGNGYKISNLRYKSTLAPKSDTGLFSYTSGAIIKNLTIDSASVQSDYRGGLVAGYAKGTTFENVKVQNSHLFVAATDNVLTLITDGGIRGGAIVGDAEDSVLYDCEGKNNFINTNNTSGVAALSGKGLFLGGLVGISNNTTIEYSRVIGGNVKNYYDVAVGALGGNILYVGGIVAQMKGTSKVIDSFSTATLYYYCATYVSVGAGNSGHIGGIAASTSGDKTEIIRSYYSGVATSKQYNAVLVVPVIQKNTNISGLVDSFDGGAVTYSYFNKDANSDVSMNVLGNSTSTSLYGGLSADKFADKSFWEDKNYDFSGTIARTSEYSSNHYNKWIMDMNLNIPVHGKSVSATLDFTSAGSVEISKSELVDTSVSTNNPYEFAIQGALKEENKISVSAEENSGYKFVGWYKIPNVSAEKLSEDYSYFKEVFEKYNIISNDSNYEDAEFDDNTLFIGRYKASVIFHDINGNIIDKTTGVKNNNTDDDWYYYDDTITSPTPSIKPSSINANLIGWTTIKSNTLSGGYENISSAELASIKAQNEFYTDGDSIVKHMDLYPVYTDLLSNINTIFEGNEQDDSGDSSLRENVGYTSSTIDEDNNVIISVKGYESDGSFQDGYRFLGWFDEDNHFVSDDSTYTLKDVDLTTEHTYTAKFEYRVDYYVKRVFNTVDGIYSNGKLYHQNWQKYDTAFENIKGLDFYREIFDHWGLDDYQNDSSYSSNITSHISLYSCNKRDTGTNEETNYTVDLLSDFPGAAYIKQGNEQGHLEVEAEYDSNKYNFIGWSFEQVGANGKGTYYTPLKGTDNPHDFTNILGSVNYTYNAHLTANVTFNQKDGTSSTITRRYKEKLFSSGSSINYPYIIKSSNNTDLTNESSASIDANKYDGYYFAGWVDKDNLTDDEINDLYDVLDDAYCSTSLVKAKHYVLDDEDVVYNAMPNIYPVYLKYNITTTTAIKEVGAISGINTPEDPTYELVENNDGTANIIIDVDEDTYVTGTDGIKYELTSLIITNEDTDEILTKNNEGKYEYTITAGLSYKVVAYYEPLTLVYHLNDTDTNIVTRNNGEQVGEMPDPTYDINTMDQKDLRYIFLGWTNNESDEGYHLFNDYNTYLNSGIDIISSSTLVNKSLELWPVYTKIEISINSSIDSIIENNNDTKEQIRSYNRDNLSEVSLSAETKYKDYEFVGWYINYQSNDELGTMVSDNNNYVLSTSDVLESTTYTAVYKEVYKISYHDINGNIIYTVNVDQDEQRSFVTSTVDNDNNTVYTPIDYEAFYEIYELLNPNESFINWQWINNDNVIEWNDFYNDKITQSMDLYPIIRSITVYDKDNNEMDLIGDDENDPEIIIGTNKENILVYFNSKYEKSNITVQVNDLSYKENSSPSTICSKDINTTLYADNLVSSKILGNGLTDDNGKINFELEGNLTISPNNLIDNEVFIFDIFSVDDPDNVITQIVFNKNESVNIKLPYGNYIIKAKENWSWRYQFSYQISNSISNLTDENINFSYEKTNKKWFDSSMNNKNVYN